MAVGLLRQPQVEKPAFQKGKKDFLRQSRTSFRVKFMSSIYVCPISISGHLVLEPEGPGAGAAMIMYYP